MPLLGSQWKKMKKNKLCLPALDSYSDKISWVFFFLNFSFTLWSFCSFCCYNINIVLVLQSGCCKPPTACGYNYVNPNLWINPVNPSADQDCLLWNNDQNILCYNCNSCRAGLLGNLRKEWRRANLILIVAVVILIWVYVVACSAFKNAQTEELFRRYKQGWVWLQPCCQTQLKYGAPRSNQGALSCWWLICLCHQ